jgi:hypothetical protein
MRPRAGRTIGASSRGWSTADKIVDAGHQPALHRHQPRRRSCTAEREHLYCQRGEAENRIKEAQLDLFGTRASCSRFIANQFRLLLAALAYTLMQRLRALALQASELERASAATIRVRLLKIGAVAQI